MNSDRAYLMDRDRLLVECRALLEAIATKVVRESGVLQIFTSAPKPLPDKGLTCYFAAGDSVAISACDRGESPWGELSAVFGVG